MKMEYKKNSFFVHPTNLKEMKKLMDQMIRCNKIKDCIGVFIAAMQLIPDLVE